MQYKAFIDEVDRQQWHEYARNFLDYSIYQTWSYQKVRAETEGQDVSRILIKDENDEIVMMSHVRIKHIVPLGLKIGYIQWGPLIFKTDGTCRCTVEALNELCQAYLEKRVNVLRVVPNMTNNSENQKYVEMLKASGFEQCQNVPPYHTIMVRLDVSEEALRKDLHKSWRRNLRRSERHGLKVFEGYDDIYYRVFMHLYKEMHARKKFVEHVDIHQIRRIQRDLPEAQKMNISLCVLDKEPIAALVWSAFGDAGMTILSATGDKGRQYLGSYLLRWELLEHLKENNFQYLDQGGIDPEHNPGGYTFKAGMGGEEQFHIGTFDTYTNSVAKNAFKIGEKIYQGMKIFDR